MGELSGERQDCHLIRLPVELQLGIIKLLGSAGSRDDLERLSCTNTFYRGFLAPHLFRTITLCNTERSGGSVDTIASGKHARCVRYLHYKGTVPNKAEEPDSRANPPNPIPFPHSVRSVLSRLHRFPRLQSVVCEFPFDTWRNFLDIYDLPDRAETASEVRRAEEANGWRSLMAQSFTALAANRQIRFPHLELRQLPPIAVSTFSSDAWHTFLGSMQEFALSSRGWTHNFGWELSTMRCFRAFSGQLDVWFFNHLNRIHHFVLEASETAPIGGKPATYDPHRHPLALRAGQMPLLRSIHMRYLYICPELQGFIVDHANQLEEIVMCDCLCSEDDLEKKLGAMSWAVFFDAISEAKPERLQKLNSHSTEEIWWGDGAQNATEEDERKHVEVRQVLQEDPRAPFFPYTANIMKYGTLCRKTRLIRDRFVDGRDRKAYQQLEAIAAAKSKTTGNAAPGSQVTNQVVEHQWYVDNNPEWHADMVSNIRTVFHC